MAEYIVTAIDTTQIQGYVFGSNKLIENIGGSELVEMATHRWVYEALPPSNNVADPATGELDDRLTIDNLDAEVISAAAAIPVLFKTIDLAREFAGKLDRAVY